MNSVYKDMMLAGVPIANHESDLYVPALPHVWDILKRHNVEYSNARTFVNQADPHKGQLWIDIPFAFEPWWEARYNKAVAFDAELKALVEMESDEELEAIKRDDADRFGKS